MDAELHSAGRTPMEVFLLLMDEIDDAFAALRLQAARWLATVR